MIGVCQNNSNNKTQGFIERASNGRVKQFEQEDK